MATAAATPSSLLHWPSPAAPKVAVAVRLPARAARISCTAVATSAPSSPAAAATDRGVYNFATGPATLPLAVLQKAQAELVDYRGSGMSIMEMSHCGKEFDAAIKEAEADLRALLAVLDTHEVLFLQGGATTHFAAVPLNLCASLSDPIDFVVSGSWSFKAFEEAKKFSVAWSDKDGKYTSLPPFDAIKHNPEARPRKARAAEASSLSCWFDKANHYWLHMDDHEKSFIKVMIGDFKSAVTVPEKFARNFTGQISETVKLETRNAESVPSSEEIEESANSGGVQKPTKPFYYLATMRNMTSKQKASVDALGEKIQPKIPFYITAMHKASVADGSLTWEINLDINTDGPYALSTGWLDFIHDNKLQEGCALSTKNPMNGAMKLGDHIVYISRVNRLNDQQKRKIIDALQAIQPEIPIFVAPIGNSNIGRTSLCIMAFNVEYAAKFLPHLDQAIKLNRPGKNIIWETKFQIKRGRHWLACGWRQFVRDNKLGIGDVCLFQLMKDEEVMAEKGCESCSEWQEHYYREHMDVSRIRFFKLMIGDFAHAISIPEKVAKIFSGQIIKGFNLKAPSGETWHVSFEKVADELLLMSGWEDFAKAHELQENDLLLFTCNGHGSGSSVPLMY
ncbi:hypothetical protein E2562_020152 [Oryza meyeriana var. granulata]|uniref:TF-B3 domain-containing protein n=1 Tax=Oryza meyeriana var. granulata TaxID=110450 RepID=A0A6G1BLY4_9ORYZ|nr:hypothetical protein E2562_020152 [Oryza meyeriana var. granulata]